MNEAQKNVRHPKPSRLARTLINALVSNILRSRWHRLMSSHLLLITFTGRKSGKKFTTPMRYTREGNTLQMTVVYPWWKNLTEEGTVHILLCRKMYTGLTEVIFGTGDTAIVKVHLVE